jgi:hypothetical protein
LPPLSSTERQLTLRDRVNISWGTAAWLVLVLASVCAQPFTLGFYLDDWPVCALAAKAGPPFSKALLRYVYAIDSTRPGLVPIRFLLSSLFRDHAFLWQAGLLIANCAMALALVWLVRAFLGEGVSKHGMWIGAVWLVLPWNAAASFWPTYLPSVLVLLMFGLLCAYSIRSWDRQRHNALWMGAIYLWICLSYEAFYFQWIALALIGLAMVHFGRARLRDVLFSSTGLLVAQICAALVHVLIVPAPGMERPIVSDWLRVATGDLLTIIPTMFRSAWEVRAAMSILGRVLIVVWAFEAYRSRKPAMLGFCFLVGGVLSIVAFALGGRGVAATGVDTRTLLIFNYWFVLGAAVLSGSALARSGPRMNGAIALVLAGLGGSLAFAHVLRSRDWAAAWSMETTILADAPLADLRSTPPGATVVFAGQAYVNGAPIFTAAWDLNSAMPWKYPSLQGRTFVVYNPYAGALAWDAGKLAYGRAHPLAETRDVYIWQPARRSFTRATGPFRIRPDLTVESH